MAQRQHETAPAPRGMVSAGDPSSVPPLYARRMAGFLPARNGSCTGVNAPAAIYKAEVGITGIAAHTFTVPYNGITHGCDFTPRLLVADASGYLYTHRIFLRMDRQTGKWSLVPELDLYQASNPPPLFTSASVGLVSTDFDAFQFGDETIIPQNEITGSKRFVATDIANTEVDRLYPLGMDAPADFVTPTALAGNDVPYFSTVEATVDPLKWLVANQASAGSGYVDAGAYITNPPPHSRGTFDLTEFRKLTATPIDDDAWLYFVLPQKYGGIVVNIDGSDAEVGGTAHNCIMFGQYWNGTAWKTLLDFADGTYGNAGSADPQYYTTLNGAGGSITWAVQDDWASTTVGAGGTTATGYAVRMGVTGHNLPGSNVQIVQVTPLGGWSLNSGTYGIALTDVDEHGRESSRNEIYYVTLGVPNDNKHWDLTIYRNSQTWSGSAWVLSGYFNAPYGAATGSGDGQRVGWNYYRTESGKSTLYKVNDALIAYNDLDYYTDTMTDSILIVGDPCADPGYNDPPNQASVGIMWRDRVFMDDLTDPTVVQASNAGSATQYALATDVTNPASGVRINVGGVTSDAPVAFADCSTSLLVFNRKSVWQIIGDDTTQFISRFVSPQGCASRRSVVTMPDGGVYYAGLDGIYRMGFGGEYIAQKISEPIQNYFEGAIVDADYPWPTPVSDLLSKATAWATGNRYYISFGGVTLAFDTQTSGWFDTSLGGVTSARVVSLDLGQSHVSPTLPRNYPVGTPAPQIVLMTPCDEKLATSKLLWAHCDSMPVVSGSGGLAVDHPMHGIMEWRQFDSSGTPAVDTVKRLERLTVWGSVDITSRHTTDPILGQLHVRSDRGVEEVYDVRTDLLNAEGTLVYQGFLGMVGTVFSVYLDLPDTRGVTLGFARMEYTAQS